MKSYILEREKNLLVCFAYYVIPDDAWILSLKVQSRAVADDILFFFL